MREILRMAWLPVGLALFLLGAACLPLRQDANRAGYLELAGLPSAANPAVAPRLPLIASAAAAEAPRQQPQKKRTPSPSPAKPQADPSRPTSEPHDAVRRPPGEPGAEPALEEAKPALPNGMEVFSRGNQQRKVVALTLDDGPRPEAINTVLPILKRYKVKATFFFVGKQAMLYPELVVQTADAGHEIGNHTYDHLRLPKLSDQAKSSEIERCQNLLWSITGKQPLFMRPPGCELDHAARRVARSLGLIVAMYDVNLRDDGKGVDPQQELRSALERVRPGSVILGHSASLSTQAILPELLQTLLDRGYTFVTISELAKEAGQQAR
jgi:peptidoglycan-N-acetylglucosamine deacetylase